MSVPGTKGRRRGEPLVVLLAVVVGWVGVRAAVWEPPFPVQRGWQPVAAVARNDGLPSQSISNHGVWGPSKPSRAGSSPTPMAATLAEPRRSTPIPLDKTILVAAIQPRGPTEGGELPYMATPMPSGSREVVPTISADSPSVLDGLARADAPALLRHPRDKRWRVDGWAMWRSGENGAVTPNGSTGASVYGGSQGGAVARYYLGSGSRSAAVVARVVHAPGRFAQSDLALGLSARPLSSIPVRLHGEGRASKSAGSIEVRPAAFAVSDWPAVALPFDLSLETYAQAGWVGGRASTAFVDGQARLDRKVAQLGPAVVRLGGGVWGGAQKGASRLDLGPSVGLDLRDSGVPVRFSVDYRIGVAGNAAPGDGPAVTLSTGF